MVGRRGRRWATLFLFTVSTSCSLWQLYVAFAHVQGSFRDSFPCSFPDIPGALESSQRAELVGDTSIRTAGIVEPSVSQKVDGGPEEGHGRWILRNHCINQLLSRDSVLRKTASASFTMLLLWLLFLFREQVSLGAALPRMFGSMDSTLTMAH